MRATIAAFLLPLALLRAAAAGDARFVMPKSETFEGVPLQVLVEVNDAADVKAPAAPDIPGATVRVLERGRQQMSEFRNGRVKTSTSITYAVEITPERTGALEIPAIEIVVDGKRFTSRPQHVDVRRSDAGDVLSAEIFGQPPEVFIGQPLEVVLRIAIRPYKDQAYGQLNESQMWQLVDLQNSQWGVFEQELVELHQRNASPRVQQETRDGQVWFVYELTRRIWPPKTGAPEVGDIRIRMTYPLALREVPTLFFERQLTISESRPLAVTASPTGISVLPLPEAGKTPAFTGAVGRFSFSVAAKPTTVAVGDPLTLTLTVTDLDGGANMETLQPPALAASAALAKDFRVPNEPLSGVVTGNAKRFTVTVRPLRAGTAELPSIDFSSFDPKARRYVTARSAPVPITVTPSTQMDLSKIVSAGGTAPAEQAAPGTKLTEVAGGLVANRPVTPAIAADERPAPGPSTFAALALPPAAAALAFAWRLHRARHERDGGLARRSGARRAADRRLREARDAAGIAGAVTGFVEDSTGRAPGTITHGDLDAVLRGARTDDALRARATALVAACDRARYSGGGAAVQQLAAEAAEVLAALDTAGIRGNGGGR
jgi:hypothetical protein